MQHVWKAGLSWDEQLPLDIAELWRSFVADLSNLQCVRIPRFIDTRRDMQCSICGFCDASSTGYAAVVYHVPHESFKIFVSNRIYKIHSLVPTCQWHYIESVSNPPDCGSRGLTPSDFIKHDLYFNGPPCLSLPPQQWDQYIPINTTNQLPEFKVESVKMSS